MSLAIEQLKNKVSILMGDEEFVLLFDMIKNDLAKQILLTDTTETEKRESLYWQCHGVTLLQRKLVEIDYDNTKENM